MDDKVLEKFGDNLRYYRKRKNFSQEKLATATNLNRSHISAIECGKKNISLKTIYILAKPLDINVIEFFLDDVTVYNSYMPHNY